MDYKQPDFFHFSDDSTQLANLVINLVKQRSPKSLLDIGAGCGFLGIEIANKVKEIHRLVLLEPQEEFQQSIEFNIENLLIRKLHIDLSQSWFSEFHHNELFDLIVCNPPYFHKDSGRKSPNINKQIARTFEVDSPLLYMEKILSLLCNRGQAYILIPRDQKQWNNAKDKFSENLEKVKCLSTVDIFLINKDNIDQ